MQLNKHHYVTLYLKDEYEQLALETYFDIRHVDVLIGNRPSFECKLCGNLFKDKNTLSYHIMMNLCPNYTSNELLKMYPMMKKVELKELNKLGEKFGYHIGWMTWNRSKTQSAINDASARMDKCGARWIVHQVCDVF